MEGAIFSFNSKDDFASKIPHRGAKTAEETEKFRGAI
jgi:hypothetical protein